MARYVRSICLRSSVVGEATSLLSVYYNTSQNFISTYNYSNGSKIWLVLFCCYFDTMIGDKLWLAFYYQSYMLYHI